jgi:hypothetical protein
MKTIEQLEAVADLLRQASEKLDAITWTSKAVADRRIGDHLNAVEASISTGLVRLGTLTGQLKRQDRAQKGEVQSAAL